MSVLPSVTVAVTVESDVSSPIAVATELRALPKQAA